MKIKILFFLLLFTQIIFGQTANEKLIHGKIIADSIALAGIDVVNLVNEKATVTDANGEFFILAKAEDLLFISGANVEIKRKIIEEEDIKTDIVIINMIPKIFEIEEVVVNKHPEINALALGIISKAPKHYSKAERGKYSHPKGPLDALKIMITGKNPALISAIAVEKKITLFKKIDYLFEDNYYVETLKIPFDYIKGFQYYCIENNALAKSLKTKNKSMTMFLIIDLAKNYKETIACED